MAWIPTCTHIGSWRYSFEPFGLFSGQRLNRMIFGHQRFIPLVLLSFGVSLGFAATEFKDAEITTLKNIVEHDAGQGAAPAKMSEKIGENSKVTTAAASMAELTFGDSSITRIGANSVFSFQSKERLVKLDKGTALIHATPGNGGATVDCGGVTAAVSGSTLMASRSATGGAVFVLLESSGSMKVTTPGGQTAVIMPGQAASTGTGAKSAIQVFDVDVKKVMDTTPLVQGFKKVLPSQAEINVVSEKQQSMIREGKIEVLGVEVVATGEDGDLLVGAPRERPEPGAGGDGLDIDTAAGGDGPGAVSGAKPPPPPGAGSGMNVGPGQGPGLDSSFLSAQRKLAEAGSQGPTQLKVTLPDGISEGTLQAGTISLNSPAVQAVPVTLVSASGRNITFNFPEGSTIPVGATSIPFTFTVADDGIISNGSSNLVALSIQAFASKLSAVGGGLVEDITSGFSPVGTASDGTLQSGSSENPFVIQLPGKVAANLTAKVTLEAFKNNGEKIGEAINSIVIQAGQSVLNLTGNNLPDPKIYSSEPINIRLTVALDQIGKTISQEVKVLPRSLDNALIRAANPIRNLYSGINTDLTWEGVDGATSYEIKQITAIGSETKVVLDSAYNWLGGLANNAITKVTALTSEIQTGVIDLAANVTLPSGVMEIADAKLNLFSPETYLSTDVKKGSLELFLDFADNAAQQINDLTIKDNGFGGLWKMDDLGEQQETLVGSVNYETGLVTLFKDALGRDVLTEEVVDYSVDFIAENSVDFERITTSTGLADSDLLQFDKYFYFTDKVGVEGPTKFFADVKDPAPLELDLAKMNDWGTSTSWLTENGLAAVDFDFYAANARIYIDDSKNELSQPNKIVFQSDDVVLYADKIGLLGKFEKNNGETTLLDVSLKESNDKALTLIGGKGGIDVSNVVLDVNGADLTMETAAGVSMESALLKDIGNKFEVSAATSVKMGVESGTSEVTVQAKSETANSMAVIRTGDSLELRRVVLKSFARGEIVSVSAANKGRVLLSAATARDFRINELVNAVIVADEKGQANPLLSTSPNLVALGGNLTVEGSLPIKTAQYQGVDVHGYNVNLEASRIHLAKAQITAINAITAKAQTLVVDSSILRVVNALGSINLYSQSGSVNPQYGTVVEGMVNFSGLNTFQIGAQTVSISSAQDVQKAFNSGMMNQGGAAPVDGKINILRVDNVSAAATSQLN